MIIYLFNSVQLDRSLNNVLYMPNAQTRLQYLQANYSYTIKEAEDKYLNENRLILKFGTDFNANLNYLAVVDDLALKPVRFYFVDDILQQTNNNYLITIALDTFATYFTSDLEVSSLSLVSQSNLLDSNMPNYASNISILSNVLESNEESTKLNITESMIENGGFYILLNCHTSNAIGKTFIFKSDNVLEFSQYLDVIGDLTYQNASALGIEFTYVIDSIYYLPYNMIDYTLTGDFVFGKTAQFSADLISNVVLTKEYTNIQNNPKKRLALKYGENIDYINTNLTKFDLKFKGVAGYGVFKLFLGVDNEFSEITDKFQICVYSDSYTQYEAFNKSIMNYQKYARSMALATSLLKTEAGVLTGLASSNQFLQAGAIKGAAEGVLGGITSYDASVRSENAKFSDMRNTPVAYGSSTSGFEIIENGMNLIELTPANSDDIDRISNLYGYAFTTTNIPAPNNSIYIGASSPYNFRYFKYEYIYFNSVKFDNNILNELTALFTRGVRVWYKSTNYLKAVDWYNDET